MSQASIDISSLLQSKRESVSAIRIRGFCAKDDLDSCVQFQEGHLDVLRSFGFKVSSTKEDWMISERVFVVIVESLCGSKTYGGARIELIDPNRKLPIQLAIQDLDSGINDFVNGLSGSRSGELCGLWNSVAVAGMGIGSVYSIRAAIALGLIRDVDSLIALCSVHSFKMASSFGFSLVNNIGQNGVVYYEGAKQNAHITFQPSVKELASATQNEVEKIRDLVSRPNQIIIENRNEKELEIHYQLS